MPRVDRSKLADISEIVSSIAIVVTLIYLTVEVQQNTNALLAQSRETVLATAQQALGYQIDNPEIALSIIKREPLTPEEMIRLNAWYVGIMRTREYIWAQYQSGIIDEPQWQTELAVLQVLLQPVRTRNWWNKLGRPVFGPEFVAFVDQQVADVPTSDELWKQFINPANY